MRLTLSILLMQFGDSRQLRESVRREGKKPTDKEINSFIHELEPKANRHEEYNKTLCIWNEFAAHRALEKKQAGVVLAARPKDKPNSMGSNLCQVCYEQMPKKRSWCRVCGSECCDRCATRLRLIPNQVDPILFCIACDKQFLIAMMVKEEDEKFTVKERAFLKLAEEQQMIESLLKIQQNKLMGDGQQEGGKNQLLSKMNTISELSYENQQLKQEISEVKKKIEWGEDIKIQLRKKLKKLKKDQSHSFTSSVHEQNEGWAPPRVDAQECVSVENLNESIINSILENEAEPEVKQHLKCNCSIF